MSNIIEYREILAFHPGYYVAELIEDMEITQAEFAMRMNTTAKTISKLVNGQCNLSNDLAQKLSVMLGTDIELWLNLQKNYDKKVAEIEQEKYFDSQAEVAGLIDYSYFVRVANLPNTRNRMEKIANLCKFFCISNLQVLKEPDFLVNYRTGISAVEEKNMINAQAWLQTAINFANSSQVEKFSAEKLRKSLSEIRSMTIQEPEVFLPRLKEIFAECGVIFVLLPHLKNSGINGAVKWFPGERVMLAMNDRRCYADTFWFSLFHEIRHILQQKHKMVFISGNGQEREQWESALEREADEFASNYLIPLNVYQEFCKESYITDAQICRFAEEIGIHPGIVAGRLQHDKKIALNRCSQLKVKYQILVEE